MKLMITGGAGFIGSAVVRLAIARGHDVVNLDALTYAACLDNVAGVADSAQYAFEQIDIRNRAALDACFARHAPDAVMHLAAESHVDRSIDGPADFIETNITGTFNMLEAARSYWLGAGNLTRFASTTSRRTRCSARFLRILACSSPKAHPTIRARPTPRPKRPLTTSCAHGTRPTACPWF